MRAVNLLPADRRSRPKTRSRLAPLAQQPLLTGAVALVLVVVAVVGLMFRSAGSTVATKQDDLALLQQTLDHMPDPKVARLSLAEAQLAAARLSTVTSVASSRTTWDGLLDALSRVVPEDIWLDSVSMSASSVPVATTATPAPAPEAAAPTGFTISGFTYSHPSVARLMRRLELIPWLTGVSLVSSEQTELQGKAIYKFTLSASVRNVEDAS